MAALSSRGPESFGRALCSCGATGLCEQGNGKDALRAHHSRERWELAERRCRLAQVRLEEERTDERAWIQAALSAAGGLRVGVDGVRARVRRQQ